MESFPWNAMQYKSGTSLLQDCLLSYPANKQINSRQDITPTWR